MKILKKQMKKLNMRRTGFDREPPYVGEFKGHRGPQQHGQNAKGNVAKRPGSMKSL